MSVLKRHTYVSDNSLFLQRPLQNEFSPRSVEIRNRVPIRGMPDILGTHTVKVGLEAVVRPGHYDSINKPIPRKQEQKIILSISPMLTTMDPNLAGTGVNSSPTAME